MKFLKLLVLVLFSAAHPLLAQHHDAAPALRSDSVHVSGLVEHPLLLTAAASGGLGLKAAPAHEMRNGKGDVKKRIPAFRGYLLKDIVEKAVPVMPEHKDQGKYLVVVTATDGYTVVFSYNELVHGPAAAWLIPVAGIDVLQQDGPFVVLCTSDAVSAPRYVKWVRSIEVRKI